MRRWVLIMLLLIYPFQVSLAMADKCCVTTSLGVTHHGVGPESSAQAAQPVFLADDDALGTSDPHCAACTFAHAPGVPSAAIHLPPFPAPAFAYAAPLPQPGSCLPHRPERPKWAPAAA